MIVATLLYGSKQYWHTVKAHHLEYVRKVLSNRKHPRYILYSKINANLSTNRYDGASGLNLWMRLCTPYEWQDSEILQVTADLYDVLIVQYTMKSSVSAKVEGVKVRGNYNSTHWLIRFVDNNHFQPLMPAGEQLSEFSFPPITRENTKGKVSIPKTIPQRGTDLNHPWRSPISRQDIPEQLLPRQAFREMSILDFALIAGFNTKDSILDSKYLQVAYHRALAEPRELSSLADGTETVESKITQQEEQCIHLAKQGHIIQRKLTEAVQSPIVMRFTNSPKGTSSPPKSFFNMAQGMVVKPIYEKANVESKADYDEPFTQNDKDLVPSFSLTGGGNVKKRTIEFITRDECERREVLKRKK